MREIEDFTDERLKAWCIHCGAAIADVESNRDHVPTKSLLTEGLRERAAAYDRGGGDEHGYLPQVVVCRPCNSGFSPDENYFLCVLHAVTVGSLYRRPSSAFRELISNAYDADATEVILQTDAPRFQRIVVRDNGRGMSPEALADLVTHIGGSSKRTAKGKRLGTVSETDPTLSVGSRRLIGKIGIGMFSVSQLTQHFQVITKRRGDDYRTSAVIVMKTHTEEMLASASVSVSGFRVGLGCTHQTFVDHLQSLDLGRASGVMILTDDALAGLVALLGDVFSVNRFAAPGYGQNVVNLLQAVLSKALRTFRVYKNRFDDLKYQQVLRLPLRNFDTPEIGELQTACRDMMNRANFGQEFEAVLKRLRGRQRPKKAQSAPVTYLVDNSAKHFTLGHGLHAQAETAIPPHNELCILGNAFRFGRAFDGRRHFNVSRDGGRSMVGQYPDCHGTVRGHPTASHVNMFTND